MMYTGQGSNVSIWILKRKIKIEGYMKKIKIIKIVKYYSYRERLKKLELTLVQERNMRTDLIETL